MSNFASILKNLRTEHKMTQEELAHLLGVSRSTISSYENGSRNPDKETLIILANCFDVSVDYLLGRDRDVNCEYNDIIGEINTILHSAPLPVEKKKEIMQEVRDYFSWKIDQARRNPPKVTKE